MDYFRETSCYRPCEEGSPPRICYYNWTLQNYKTMGPACRNCPANVTDCFQNQCITADGYERGIIAVNNQLPGPSIQVCFGDRIIVDVVNRIPGQTTTIHWHGTDQIGTPHMDGVPMITQCPISQTTTFRYDFKADTFGTLYWHSHNGFQKQDGIQGAMVVRRPTSLEPNSHLYDYDLASHVIFVSDWMKSSAGEHLPGLETHDKFQNPDSILINGKGRKEMDGLYAETPLYLFRVRQGKNYRFRIVGGMCTSCAYKFSISHHTLLVIAVDGCPVEPVRVNSIDMYGGERYDFVLEASEEVRSYWIHVEAIGNCEELQLYSLGILRYSGAKSQFLDDPGYTSHHDEKVLNPYNGTCSKRHEGVCIHQLIGLEPVAHRVTAQDPDVSFSLRFGFHTFSVEDLSQHREYETYFEPSSNRRMSSVVNNISFSFPSSPLLSQRHDVKQSVVCPKGQDGAPRCPLGSGSYCQCLHIIQIPLCAVAQFILIDKGNGGVNHPFHLHGYSFYVIAMGTFENGQTEDDIIEGLHRGTLEISKNPPFRDTIAVPASGYTVIRILARNPGYWFFHCHVLYHGTTGMALVLQVGEDSDMPRPPPGFPKCGDYVPAVYDEKRRTFSTYSMG
ncbi:laccase isoform X2 [Cryptotermes secundus]|nr:laccase isoform X2 [Cryptotermes secundus]